MSWASEKAFSLFLKQEEIYPALAFLESVQ
jgi:hypothetical protein